MRQGPDPNRPTRRGPDPIISRGGVLTLTDPQGGQFVGTGAQLQLAQFALGLGLGFGLGLGLYSTCYTV